MKIAVMQPYLFPYIGYYQLINNVDRFVIYDDVNYIVRGWINRNRILLNGKEYFISLALSKSSQNKLINEIFICEDDKIREKLIKTIMHAYGSAPQYQLVFPLLKQIITYNGRGLHSYIEFSLKRILEFLDIRTELIFSSAIKKNNDLTGQAKILEICKRLKATEYVNPIGGKELYSKEEFKNYNIDLYFLKTNEIAYEQFTNEFVPNLSIIDVLMFNPKGKVIELLNKCVLI